MSIQRGVFFTCFEQYFASLASRNDCQSYLNQPKTLWVGLSAGVDSTVLLHSLASWLSVSEATDKFQIKALHVHHGLSSNADAWAEQAKQLCEQISLQFAVDIECIVERVDLVFKSSGIEQAARIARYQVFEQHCEKNDFLLQGHHLDDQLETFFMRALRGSGLTGLAGIPFQRPLSRHNDCQIIRPFLNIEKKQIIEYAIIHDLTWVDDESNLDTRYDRNWWRNDLLPQIWQRYPDKKQTLARSINTVRDEQQLLQDLIIEKINYHSKLQEKPLIHPALQQVPHFNISLIQYLDQTKFFSYIRAWLAQYVDLLPSATHMPIIYNELVLASSESTPIFTWGEQSLCRYKNCLYLINTSINAKKTVEITPDKNKIINWQGESINWQAGQILCSQTRQAHSLTPGIYTIRGWQAGDVAKPFGRSTRKMKKWWQDFQVPAWAREHWPIIVNQEDAIVAVPSLFVCDSYVVDSGQCGWSVEYKLTDTL